MSEVRPPMPVATTAPRRSGSTAGAAGLGPGLAGGDEGRLLRSVELAGLDPVEHLGGIDGHDAGDLGRLVGDPVLGASR